MNPITDYGRRLADQILSNLNSVPPTQRAFALEAVFAALEQGLLSRVHRNMRAGQSIHTALASALSEGFAKEIVSYGQGKRPSGLLGLGTFDGQQKALDGFWDGVKSVAKTVTSVALVPVTGGASLLFAGGKVGSTAQGVAKSVWDFGIKTLNTAGKMACQVLQTSAAPVAGAAAATAAGVPPSIGATGANIAGAACGPGAVVAPVTAPVDTGMPAWVLPAAIGGVGLVAVLLLTRKKDSAHA